MMMRGGSDHHHQQPYHCGVNGGEEVYIEGTDVVVQHFRGSLRFMGFEEVCAEYNRINFKAFARQERKKKIIQNKDSNFTLTHT